MPTTGSPASMSDVATPTWAPRRGIRHLCAGRREPFSDNDLSPLLAHLVQLPARRADPLAGRRDPLATQPLAGGGDRLLHAFGRRPARHGVRRHELPRVERAPHRRLVDALE